MEILVSLLECVHYGVDKGVQILIALAELFDFLDGVKDGVIENPKKCKFDPAVLACKGGSELISQNIACCPAQFTAESADFPTKLGTR